MSPSPRRPADTKRSKIETCAHTVARQLRALRNPARARQTQRYFKQPVEVLGLDAATQYRLAREQTARLAPTWTGPDAVALCERLLQEPEIEIRGAGLLILHAFERELRPSLLPRAKRWLASRLDNWALVDNFCGGVLAPLLGRHPTVAQALRRWSRDRSLWVRRAALVTLVPFARRGRQLDLTFELVAAHLADREDLIHKAMGWLLREAGKTEPARLTQFLLAHGPRIPRTTVRYAIERMPAAERARLLRVTRGEPDPPPSSSVIHSP